MTEFHKYPEDIQKEAIRIGETVLRNLYQEDITYEVCKIAEGLNNERNRRAPDPSRDALVEALKETLAIARRDEAGDFIQRAEEAITQAEKALENEKSIR